MSIYVEESRTTFVSSIPTYTSDMRDSQSTFDRYSLHDHLEEMLPIALQELSQYVKFHSVVIAEKSAKKTNLHVWHHEQTPTYHLKEAISNARNALLDTVLHISPREPQSEVQFHSGRDLGFEIQSKIKAENRIILPLIFESDDPFGLIQIECISEFDERHPVMPVLRDFTKRVAETIVRDNYRKTILELEHHLFKTNLKLSLLERENATQTHTLIAKRRFMASVSHELRTPLGIILGFVDLLDNADIPSDEKGTFLQTIRNNGELLAKIIDDVLDISKLEEGKFELQLQDFSIQDLLRDLENSFALKMKTQNLSFHVLSNIHGSDRMHSDPFRLKQILFNLIQNALKFTEQGSITLRVSESLPLASSTCARTIQFSLQDTGIGMCRDEANHIFLPFEQAVRGRIKSYEGSGLGLAISKQLAKSLGGDLELLESVPNEGSLFELTIADQKDVRADRVIPKSQDVSRNDTILDGLRILIADDAPDNLLLLSIALESKGAHIDLAKTGIEVLDRFQYQTWDLILIDMQMPGKDGLSTTKELRSHGFTAPIFALSGGSAAEDGKLALEAGCDLFLRKPTALDELVEKISVFTSSSNISAP